MADDQFTVRYDNFGGGDWGRLGERDARPGMFQARNLVRYRNGMIGPRCGLKALTPAGIPANPLVGFGWAGTAGADLWFAVGTALYLLDTANPVAVQNVAGALDSIPTRPLASVEVQGRYTYLTNYGDETYVLDHSLDTLTKIVGSPGGSCIALYGDRMIVAGPLGANGNRVYYSEAGVFTSWPALNYFDIGYNGQVRALFPQRGGLTIVMQDGSWWVLTGAPDVGVVRRISGGGVHPWHFYAAMAAAIGDDMIWFVPVGQDHPATFNGATVERKSFEHLTFMADEVTADSGNDFRVCRGYQPDEVLFLQGVEALARINGVWARHTFRAALQLRNSWIVSNGQGQAYLADGGAAGVAPTFFVWSIGKDRPGKAADTDAQPGDASAVAPEDMWLNLPEIFHPEGKTIRVRSVLIEFTAWNTGTGAGTDNEIGVGVQYRGQYQLDAGTDGILTAVQYFTEAVGAANVLGTTNHRIFNFGEQPFTVSQQVKLMDIKGCAIRSVTVKVDVGTDRT